jgi:phosphopantothenoylcysteine decarboxylase/phosphopantothenate--cysteine ligase
MHAAVLEHLAGVTLFVGAAAVADLRPETVAAGKVKKEDAGTVMRLERNPDIIADVAAHKPTGCFVAGFAAETDDIETSAREKMMRKALDCIVVNRIGSDIVGFASDENEAVILWPGEGRQPIPRGRKSAVAAAVLDRIASLRAPR